MKDLIWKCDVCGRKRPDDKIEVCKVDVSQRYNLAPGLMVANIRYCVDNEHCVKIAPSKAPQPF